MENSTFFDQIITIFSNWYSPAGDMAQATDFMSTDEIVNALNQFHPSVKVTPEDVYQLMTDSATFNRTILELIKL